MKTQKKLFGTAFFALTVCATLSTSVQAYGTQERIVTSVEYQLTDVDTKNTARKRAIDKARLEVLSEASKDFLTTTKYTDEGYVVRSADYSQPEIMEENILSESLGNCATENMKELQCYKIQFEAFIDTGFVLATPEQIEDAENALRTAEELLAK